MELTKFEQHFVAVVVRYITPMLLYLLYSRLTITTILLSFRRVKRKLRILGDDRIDMQSSIWTAMNDAVCSCWPQLSGTYRAAAILSSFITTQQRFNVPAHTQLNQAVAFHGSRQYASAQLADRARQLRNVLIPPDVIRFIRTFNHGISSSAVPLGRFAQSYYTVLCLLLGVMQESALMVTCRWAIRVRRRGQEELYDIRELLQIIILARAARENRIQSSSSRPHHCAGVGKFDRIQSQCRHIFNDVSMFMADLVTAMEKDRTAKEGRGDAPGNRSTAGSSTHVRLDPGSTNYTKLSESELHRKTDINLASRNTSDTLNTLTPTVAVLSTDEKQMMSAAPQAMGTSSSIASVQSLSALGSMSSIPYTSGAMAAQSRKPRDVAHATIVQPLPGIIETYMLDSIGGSPATSGAYTYPEHGSLAGSTADERSYCSTPSSDRHGASDPLELVPSLGLNVAASLIKKLQARNSASSTSTGEPVGEAFLAESGLDKSRSNHDKHSEARQSQKQVQSVYRATAPTHARRHAIRRRKRTEEHRLEWSVSEHPTEARASTPIARAVLTSMSSSLHSPDNHDLADQGVHRQAAERAQLQTDVDELTGQLSLPKSADGLAMAQLPEAATDLMWQYNALSRAGSHDKVSTDSSMSDSYVSVLQPHHAPGVSVQTLMAGCTVQTYQTAYQASEWQRLNGARHPAAKQIQIPYEPPFDILHHMQGDVHSDSCAVNLSLVTGKISTGT